MSPRISTVVTHLREVGPELCWIEFQELRQSTEVSFYLTTMKIAENLYFFTKFATNYNFKTNILQILHRNDYSENLAAVWN